MNATQVEWGYVHKDGSVSTALDEEQARSLASGLGYRVTGEVVSRTVTEWQAA